MGCAGLAARTRRWVCGGSLILALLAPAAAEAAPALVKVGDFAEPVYATGAPGDPDRVFVVERAGRVKVGAADVPRPVRRGGDGRLRAGPAVAGLLARLRDLGALVRLPDRGRDRGHPDPRVPARHRDAADPASARVLLTIPHRDAGNHNGGQLHFGPDGLLWLGDGRRRRGLGLGAGPGVAARQGDQARRQLRRWPTVVASGLRNPWRFSFDRANGQIVIADVGDGLRRGDQRRVGRQLRLALPRGSVGYAHGRSALRERHRRSRCSTRRTAATGSARSPAATSCATPACRRCSGATCTATSARPRCARWISRTGVGRALGLDGAAAELVR